MPPDVQLVTLVEAALLLTVNAVGVALTALAWRVSEVDVCEALTWTPWADEPDEVIRRRHNRLLVTEDARHGEMRRLEAHLLVGVVGAFWILTPQPTNPSVVWWAVAIRICVIALSCLLIDKTAHHLISRYRFDRPELTETRARYLWPALRLAWRDALALGEIRQT